MNKRKFRPIGLLVAFPLFFLFIGAVLTEFLGYLSMGRRIRAENLRDRDGSE